MRMSRDLVRRRIADMLAVCMTEQHILIVRKSDADNMLTLQLAWAERIIDYVEKHNTKVEEEDTDSPIWPLAKLFKENEHE